MAALAAAAWMAYTSADTVSAAPPVSSVTVTPSGGASEAEPPARVPVSPIDDSFPASLDEMVGFGSSQVFSADVLEVGPRRDVKPLPDDPFQLEYRPVRVRVTHVYAGSMKVGEETFLRDPSRPEDGGVLAGTADSYDVLWPTGQSLTVLSEHAVDGGDGISAVAPNWVFVNTPAGSSVEITQLRGRGLGDTPVPTVLLEKLLTEEHAS